MDTADSQHLSRISKMLLAGIGVAFAWVLLSFALGLGASQAHAGEDGGLLGDLTSTVEETAVAVTSVVEGTATTVVQPVAPVVQAVVKPVAPVVESVASVPPVADVVETVVAPVTNTVSVIADYGVVAPIVDSTVAVVDTVPVVNEVVSALGIDTAATTLGSSVDGLLQGTAGAVTGTLDGVTGTLTDAVDSTTGIVTSPDSPVVAPLLASSGVVTSTVVARTTDAEASAFDLFARTAYTSGATALLALAPELPATFSAADGAAVTTAAAAVADISFALLRSVMQADSAFVGPSGAGPGAWVLVALGFVIAYRAWVRRSGPENDVAPAAPVLSTDVSPD
ncbi:hypothetical protein LG299_10980 [Microbacterium lacus]|uniref:hypothetical protein n=1 Tax=Microbacterium lacus TaxID=415217 RepID=UPI00384AD570